METETRAHHLEWCKKRAIQYCDANDPDQAMASFVSDMRKHEATEEHLGLRLMMQMKFAGLLNSNEEMRKFILGFN